MIHLLLSSSLAIPVWFSLSIIISLSLSGRSVLDLPTSGTHPLPCHYVVISDNERVSANSLSYAYLRSDGREASLARNLTANSTSESLAAPSGSQHIGRQSLIIDLSVIFARREVYTLLIPSQRTQLCVRESQRLLTLDRRCRHLTRWVAP